MFFGGDSFNMGSEFNQAPRNVNNIRLYKILNVSPNADKSTIKKAFRKLAMKNHPDKGGDKKEFQSLVFAHDILTDDDKRKKYDEYGEEGLKDSHPDMSDIFNIFNFGGSSRDRNRRRVGEDVAFPLKASLEDLYNGATKSLKLHKDYICNTCSGKGNKSGMTNTCEICKGRGTVINVRRIGSSMLQQVQQNCRQCKGTGIYIKSIDRCKTCKGNRVIKRDEILKVNIIPGMKDGQKIVFKGQADESPDYDSGDVIIIIKEKDHHTFSRDGMNLLVNKKITLLEALSGVSFTVKHLDERILQINHNQVITHGQRLCILKEGMPQYENQFEKGGLFIQFHVEFPKKISKEQKKLLGNILPRRQIKVPEKVDQKVELTNISLEELKEEQKEYETKEAYREDDEEETDGGRTRANCQTQ